MPDECGPQDSNLQPRDSSAPAFPRGLDYLILLGRFVPAVSIERPPAVKSGPARRPGAHGGDYRWDSPR